MRSLRHLYPVLFISMVFMLSIFTGCKEDVSPVQSNNNNPPEEEQLPPLGTIGVYADQNGTDCNLQDSGGLMTFYIVHKGMNGATAAQFKIETNNFNGTYLSMSSPFETVIGDPMNGVSIGYGACLPGPAHIMTLNFQSTTPSPACASISIVPHPDFDGIYVVDCDINLHPAQGMVSYINNDGSCPCGPVQSDGSSTWSKIRDFKMD